MESRSQRIVHKHAAEQKVIQKGVLTGSLNEWKKKKVNFK